MKYNKMIGLASVMVLGVSIGASVVSAGENGAEYQSNGLIEFIYNDGPTNPVDPLDPEKPVEPTDPANPEGPNTGTNGPLSIDFASSFYFGNNKITSQDMTYDAEALVYNKWNEAESKYDKLTGPNYVQVTDNRGNLGGWTLKVKQAKQFETAEGDSLNGAQVEFSNGNIATVSESVKADAVEKIQLNVGQEALIMSAKKGAGAGTFLTRWGDEKTAATSVKLHVPGKAVKKKAAYKTSFNWVLTDTPGMDVGAGETETGTP